MAATSPSSSSAAPSSRYEGGLYGMPALLAMSGIALVVLLSALDQTIVSTAMPKIIAELQGFDLYAWVATSYLLTSTVTIPIMGKFGDLYGRKPFVLAAIIVFVGASAACGMATSMLGLIIGRGVQGIGAGMIQATGFSSISDIFPQPERRVRWQGVVTSTFGLASVLGPTLGGVMTDNLGWRSVFYVNLPVGILAVIVLIFTLPRELSPRQPNARIDWPGVATITLSISALLMAVEWSGEMGWSSPLIVGLLLFGFAMLVLFVWIEWRAPEPLMPLDLFTIPTVTISCLVSLLVGFALFSLIFYTPLFAQGSLGLSASAAGVILTPLVTCIAVGSLCCGQLFPRFPRVRVMMLIGGSLFTIGAFCLSQTTRETEQIWFSVLLGMCGTGVGMLMPMMVMCVQAVVPRRRMGVGTAANQFLRQIGNTLGTALVGALVASLFMSNLTFRAPADTDPRLLAAMNDPTVLVSADAQAELAVLADEIGPQGPSQLETLMALGRDALAVGIRASYWAAVGAGVLILILASLLRPQMFVVPSDQLRTLPVERELPSL
jgi:EmrB/QacA subfamily drug resistance transporter